MDTNDQEPEWNDQFPTCTKIECIFPRIPRNGFVREFLVAETYQEHVDVFPYKYEINYACYEGYQLVGARFATCAEIGWTSKTPRCKKITCSSPTAPENGWALNVAGEGRQVGDIVQFGCFSGFMLTGTEKTICLENGQWSGELARCVNEETYCPDPGTPLHGSKIGHDYNLRDVVIYTCDNDYTLIGSAYRECLANRTWSGTESACKSFLDFDRKHELQYRLFSSLDSEVLLEDSIHQTDIVFVPAEQRRLPTEKQSRLTGRMLDVTYPNGNYVLYFVFDSSRSVGLANFKSSVDFVIALVRRVGVSRKGVRVGAMAFGNKVDRKRYFLPTDFFETDDVVRALENFKSSYSDGGTNIYEALNDLRTNIMPTVKNNPNIKDPKSHVFLLSDGIYNEGGSPIAAAASMKAMGVTFSCVAISGDKNAEKGIEVLFTIASERNNVYHLKGYDQMSWMVDHVLTNKTDYSRCGLPVLETEATNHVALGRIFGGAEVKTYWPWMAMLQKFDNMTQKFSDGFCGGSLIDQNWILTAAHCINPNSTIIWKATDIRIKLGLTKGNETTYAQTATPSQIFMHENFNISDETKTFDYDVALLKLEHPVNYGKRVRPVCLSPPENAIPEKSTLYKELSEGWAIGYGKFSEKSVNEMRDFYNLREVALDVRPYQTCKDGLTNQIYTNRMFCAGGQKGLDTCKGDSGGPFMKHQYHSEGYGYWVQTGIVSFGSDEKCGVEGKYGYYTKVASVKKWIDNIINKN